MNDDTKFLHGPEKPRKPKKKKNYEVGHSKPPKASQFKPGVSGNPRGRPKGSKNKLRGNEKKLNDHILKAANTKMRITQNGEETTMTAAQAASQMLSLKSAKGDIASTKLFFALLARAEEMRSEEIKETLIKVIKWQRVTYEYLRYHKQHNLIYDTPIPHPDHLEINWETGEVTCEGPLDQKLHDVWKVMIFRIVRLENDLEFRELWEEGEKDGGAEKHQNFDINEHEMMESVLTQMREIIPPTDLLYKEYAPGFRKQWIDYWYYYGIYPTLPEEALVTPKTTGNRDEFIHKLSREQKRRIKEFNFSNDAFRKYMREKLADLMDADWKTRLAQTYHIKRDIEFDKLRYEYHTGNINLDGFELDKYDKITLRCQECMEDWVRWT